MLLGLHGQTAACCLHVYMSVACMPVSPCWDYRWAFKVAWLFYVGTGDLGPGPQACMASAVATVHCTKLATFTRMLIYYGSTMERLT